MPSDRKNHTVKAGDIVLIPAIIKKVEDIDDFHNIICETVEPLHPAQHKSTLLLNSKQVEVVNPSIGVIVVTEQSAPGDQNYVQTE